MSLIFLIISNLLPIYGVLYLHWQWYPLVYLYWLENVAIWFYQFVKLVIITKYAKANKITPFFFLFYFGMFTLAHGVFIAAFPHEGNTSQIFYSVLPTFITLFISHSVSFFTNFLRKNEYTKMNPMEYVFAPYGRIFILQVTILIGAALSIRFGNAAAILILLVILKTLVDALSHLSSHKRIQMNILQKVIAKSSQCSDFYENDFAC